MNTAKSTDFFIRMLTIELAEDGFHVQDDFLLLLIDSYPDRAINIVAGATDKGSNLDEGDGAQYPKDDEQHRGLPQPKLGQAKQQEQGYTQYR